jgi:CheY-like chemotaxis protein
MRSAGRTAIVTGVSLTCVIVDDSEEFLTVAQALLEREGITVLGVASTATGALERVRDLQPEVVLVDIDLGPDDGLHVAERLAHADLGRRPRMILISTHAQADFAELIDAGPALGFVAKSQLSAAAIRAVLANAR